MREQVIEILRSLGIYERIKEKVKDDAELVDLFCNNFETLILKVS